jgi:exodeoxyribonuclease VII large subunit
MVELASAADALRERMDAALRRMLDDAHADVDTQLRRIEQQSPLTRLRRDRQSLDELSRRASGQLAHRIELRRAQLTGVSAQLAALNPLATLGRGYAVVRRAADGQIITDPAQAAPGAEIILTVRGGEIDARAA